MAYVIWRRRKGVEKTAKKLAPDNGKWTAAFVGPRGVEEREVLPAATRAEAKLQATELERKARRQRLGLEEASAKPITFEAAAEAHFAAQFCVPRTKLTNRGRLKHWLLPEFGDRYLADITPADIDTFLTRVADKLAPHSRELLRVHIGAIYRFAIEKMRAFHGQNPARAAARIRAPKTVPKALTLEEARAVLAHAGWARLMVLTSIMTGLRRGEVAGLLWSDIDFARGEIIVARSYDSKTTKGKRTRVVALHPLLAAELAQAKRAATSQWVFPGKRGEMRTRNDGFHKVLAAIMRRAGVAGHWRIKDLRSTFGTIAYAATGDIRFVQASLGHAHVETTEEHYARLQTSHLHQQTAKMLPPEAYAFLTRVNSVGAGPENISKADTMAVGALAVRHTASLPGQSNPALSAGTDGHSAHVGAAVPTAIPAPADTLGRLLPDDILTQHRLRGAGDYVLIGQLAGFAISPARGVA